MLFVSYSGHSQALNKAKLMHLAVALAAAFAAAVTLLDVAATAADAAELAVALAAAAAEDAPAAEAPVQQRAKQLCASAPLILLT